MMLKRSSAPILLCVCLCAGVPAWSQTSSGSNLFTRDYSKTQRWFPNLPRTYQQEQIPQPLLENSPRLKDLIHDGKLEISLADALALALENNLDIAVQRYLRPIAQTDVLRTAAGRPQYRGHRRRCERWRRARGCGRGGRYHRGRRRPANRPTRNLRSIAQYQFQL